MKILAGLCLMATLGTGSSLYAQAPSMTRTLEAPPPARLHSTIQSPPPNASGSRTPDGAIRISGGVMAGQIVKRVMPTIPRCSHSGAIVMHAIIGTDGKVEKLTLISGPPDTGFRAAVMDAVRQWEYKPYVLNGNPERVDTTIVTQVDLNGCPSGDR